jgi:hypothetical protein
MDTILHVHSYTRFRTDSPYSSSLSTKLKPTSNSKNIAFLVGTFSSEPTRKEYRGQDSNLRPSCVSFPAQHTCVPRAKDALDMIATTPPQLFPCRSKECLQNIEIQAKAMVGLVSLFGEERFRYPICGDLRKSAISTRRCNDF